MRFRPLRVFAFAAVLAVLSVSSAAPQTGSASAPLAPATGNAEQGKTLFRKAGCYQCHGDQAQGGTQGPRLGPGPIPFRAFEQYLRAPRGEMPPYTAKVVSSQELADIYAFLRALPPPPPLTSIPLLQP